ncbi:MAG: NAD-binding protein [Deltaproteobacteria bacterium]|nr:NAD-binding protein [Deltaproteobacteria bacterium]
MRLAFAYARVVLRQFRGTLLALALLVAIGTTLFSVSPLSQLGGRRPDLDSAFYAAWMALFAETIFTSVDHWYLEVLSMVFPLFGAVVVGEGVVRLGLLLMARRQGDQEWVKVVASTFSDHVVLCGLGHLGFRVLEYLVEQKVPVVCIEKDPNGAFLSRARAGKVPVIERDMRDDDALISAGIEKARLVIIATNDDLANLEVALDARRLNPKIKTAVRQFDQQIAAKLQQSFDVSYAFSSAAVAAPIVAAKALGLYAPVPVISEKAPGLVTREVNADRSPKLAGQIVADVERSHAIKVMLTKKDGAWRVPSPDDRLSGDVVLYGGEAQVAGV